MSGLPFRKVLIANRGEIACRIISTCRRLGLATVAIYSEADREALHVTLADEAWPVGPPAARDSYLRIPAVMQAVEASGADAVHPGYGFLSENPDFAAACEAAGVTYVGPPARVVAAMAAKDAAKALAKSAGVPVLEGVAPDTQAEADFLKAAREIGYPVLLKAVAGGGGRGMRLVRTPDQMTAAVKAAKREAASGFGDDRLLVERFVRQARHIEVQVLADAHGNVVHLWERDCTVQRRHQKVLEETPAPGVSPDVRAAMGEAAVRLCRAVGYVGAGTVEFIVDAAAAPTAGGFWFMEMNTRLQVEHTVTEAVMGLDLVEQQLRAAAGEPLGLEQAQIRANGHAIQVRLCAEDPLRNYLPSPGRLERFSFPADVRTDTGLRAGDEVSPWYDNLLAKVVVHAADRGAALAALRAALDGTTIEGPATNLQMLRALCAHPVLQAGEHHTDFLSRHHDELLALNA